jgi:class 3 adenylate cyclase/tetratricopeptide (TPR) repeat protein
LSYKPKPTDTSKVKLAPGLQELIERLAENTHDVWAQHRILSGWKYGPHRDDSSKEHPGLVPYNELTESEKEYDRNSSLETIKLLSALGYTIEARGQQEATPMNTSGADADSLTSLRKMMDSAAPLKLADLKLFWNARNPATGLGTVEAYRLLADRFLKMAEPLFAHDVINEGLEKFKKDVRLRQLLALSLARTGASGEANKKLEELRIEGYNDEETISLLARTHKDLAEHAREPEQRQDHFREAQKLYAEAYRLTKGYYSGINAATLALLIGERNTARELATAVRAACEKEVERLGKSNEDVYWPTATLGEAALILEDWPEAEEWYGRAAALAGKRFGDLCSTRRNARLILGYLQGDFARFERCFPIPSVAVFAGHMIDQAGRADPRFPLEIEPAVRDAIRDRLKTLNVGFGFASAACGADILFLEAILERGGEIRVLLPYEKSQFIKDSVEITPEGNWGARCEAVLKQAASITVSCDHRLTGASSVEFQYANLLVQGMATVLAKQLDTPLKPLAVWDGKPGDGLGGTSWNVARWQQAGLNVDIVQLDEILACHCPVPTVVAAPLPKPVTAPPVVSIDEFAPEICGLLFADAVGFSKLTEREVHLFVREFLGLIRDVIKKSNHPPLVKNTWGDGLHFVFGNARYTGIFALDICSAICKVDWKSKGLSHDLNLRIGLHAGPAFGGLDPVTGKHTYIGSHLSRAARIEPITPPGYVYASQAFAAMAAVEGVQEFTCEYVGQIEQAKKYGVFPTYVVRRS